MAPNSDSPISAGFSDSRYARQLSQGFHWLQFQPELEAEYQQRHLRAIRPRLVICLIALVAIGFLAAWLNAGAAPQLRDTDSLDIRNWLIRPAVALMLLGAFWSTVYFRVWLWVTPLALLMGGVAGGLNTAHMVAAGNYHAFVAMIVFQLAVYVLMGLLFWQMIVLGVLLTGAYAVALIAAHVATPILQYELLLMALVNAIGALLAYNVEFASRSSFLRTGMLEDISARDPLTGLWNRRSFDLHFEKLWKQGLRDRQAVSLLMLDVDFFKAYNDHNGHQAGDECLRRVAQTLRALERRPFDMVARFGGEEFAVLLYQVPAERAVNFATDLVRAVESENLRHERSPIASSVTVSVGVVTATPQLGRSPEGLLQLADAALYDAKSSGRNRVVVREVDTALSATGSFQSLRAAG